MSMSDDEEISPVFEANRSAPNTPLLEDTAIEDGNRSDLKRADPKFYSAFLAVENAIEHGLHPQRIEQGSSGSYFCRDVSGDIVGVFKPKNEEPYGQLNPKWTKWLHKTCCPCCFGRSCLIPNQGYLSEAGASLVDSNLGLNVVPKTKVVRFASPSFYYSKFDRAAMRAKQGMSEHFPDLIGKHIKHGLPAKTGSFQLFVRGYKDAYVVLRNLERNPLGEAARKKLLSRFQRLVVLDYIIRNTDRGNDNWLLRHHVDGDTEDIELAAIDNGLGFPFKHPDNWRTYPFHWAWLPLAEEPFSHDIADEILPKLEDEDFVEELVDQLYVLFSQDAGFSKSLFEQQMGVMRGQVLNLKKALREGMKPVELVQMTPVKLVLHKVKTESALAKAHRKYSQIISNRIPLFKWC
eukprot:m.200103 g.200103  ORF g.200103 m.200103 type:complete len:406 (-) comp21910_c0_seq3:76-1293(-)